MRKHLKPIILSLLMLVLSLSVATNSLNSEVETPILEDTSEPMNVILPLADLNVPGHQEGSIFSDTTISSGGSHTCALLDNGLVSCWGYGNFGQLGNVSISNKNMPTWTRSLGTGRTAVAISSGELHTCAILDNGSVSCWGQGWQGRLGNGGTSNKYIPTPTMSLGTGRTAVAISAGGDHTCAILDNGSVSCWGVNNYGQLGDGSTTYRYIPTPTSSLGTNRTAVALTSGDSHTCALLDNGSVSCWGQTYWGFGIRGSENTPTLTASLGTGRTAVAISAGGFHTCAILDNGSVSCWGEANYGQLGQVSVVGLTPTLTSSLGVGRSAVAISAGESHTCALLDNGSVSCWGRGSSGRLGNGGLTQKSTPTLTSSLGVGRTAVAISAGMSHTCALLDNGSMSCWGEGYYGGLGNGGTSDKSTPTLTSSLGTNRSIALSERDFDNDGTLNIFELISPTRINCNIGQYGMYVCVDAPAGKYVSASSAMYATDASAGYYVPSTGLTNQTACSPGTYQALISQSSCDSATVGHYVDSYLGTGQSSQTPCLSGTYNPNTGSTSPSACADADAGYYVPSTGQSSQTECSIGTFQTATGQAFCDDASAGFYVPLTGQLSQTPCSPGTYQSATGQIICENADAGYYVDSTLGSAQTSQTACFSGTFNAYAGSTTPADCLDANAGYYVDSSLGTGQTSQTPCPAGTYNPNTGSTSSADCISSDAGHYIDSSLGSGQSSQTPCPAGTFQTEIGQSYCDGADAGHYVDSSLGTGQISQTPCTAGSYNPSTGSTSVSDCIGADSGHFVNYSLGTGQSQQTPCPAGTYNPTAASSSSFDCIGSDPGHYVDLELGSGQSYQSPCPTGTYQPTSSQVSCIVADAGFYVDLSFGTGQTSQTPCIAGTYNPDDGSTSVNDCRPAEVGHYVDLTQGSGQSNQTTCLAGTFNSKTGSSSSADCLGADAGYYVDMASGDGQSVQTPCPAGSFNQDLTATSVSSCISATRGHYVDSSLGPGQLSQTPCSTATYNPNNGSTNASDCVYTDPGHYVNTEGQDEQLECSQGAYQPNTGSTRCIKASEGYFVNTFGAVSQTPCESGTFQNSLGQSSCKEADAGHYVNTSLGEGQATQTPCPIGTYNPDNGSIYEFSCRKAFSGSYVESSGQSNSTKCSPGFYQPESGQSECIPAEPGYYTPSEGRMSQSPCPKGTFSNTSASTECIEAGSGYYVLNEDKTQRVQCPPFTNTYVGMMTSGNNSNNPDDCWTDTDGDGLVDDNSAQNSDDDDDNDGYNDSKDAFPLDPTEWKDENGDGIGDNEKPVTALESLGSQSGKATFIGVFFALTIGCLVAVGFISRTRKDSELEQLSNTFAEDLFEHKNMSIIVPMLMLATIVFSLIAVTGTEWMETTETEDAFHYSLTEATGEWLGLEISFGYSDQCESSGNDEACDLRNSGYIAVFGFWVGILCFSGIFLSMVNQKFEFVEFNNIPVKTKLIAYVTATSATSIGLIGWYLISPMDQLGGELQLGNSFWIAMTAVLLSGINTALYFVTRDHQEETEHIQEKEKEMLVQTPEGLPPVSIEKDPSSEEVTAVMPTIPPPRPAELDTDDDSSEIRPVDIEEKQESEDASNLASSLGPPQGPPPKQAKPPADAEGVIGDDGYEWLEFPDDSGKHFYRAPGADSWVKWDN